VLVQYTFSMLKKNRISDLFSLPILG